MASNTKQTETRRLAKTRKNGRDRKREANNQGTTKSEAQLFGNTLPR